MTNDIKDRDIRKDRERIAKEKTRDDPGINSKLREGDIDQRLDKALMDSFPSSDPPALTQPTEKKPAGPAPKKTETVKRNEHRHANASHEAISQIAGRLLRRFASRNDERN